MGNDEQVVRRLYDGFNARDIEAVLAMLAPDVAWANGVEGGHVHGHEPLRAYWTEQWSHIDPHVEPVQVSRRDDHSTAVEVHQTVRDLQGALVLDEKVTHIFRFQNGYVTAFDIENPGQLSSISY